MTSPNAVPAAAPPLTAAPAREIRPMYWSVRRELWENRSLYLAPAIVSAVVLFGTLIGTIGLPGRVRNAASDPAKLHDVLVGSPSTAPSPVMFVALMVGLFYCLEALHGERKDRSILFWKSLPVSDRTTVLSKASIPLLVLPVIAYVLGMSTQLLLLYARSAVLWASGLSASAMWAEMRFFEGLVIMAYGLAAFVLWWAPIHGWFLLVSAWAKRAVLLWAVLPWLAVAGLERMVFGSLSFMRMLQYRWTGAMTEAFTLKPGSHDIDRLAQLRPGHFLTRPGLWLGLAFAAACLAAAVRLRRHREPI
ncbi:MAG: ABC transporter permease [Thermoanaerobaculia bacterium]